MWFVQPMLFVTARKGEHRPLTIAFVDRGLGLHALLLIGVSLIFIQPALFSNHAALKPWILLITAMLILGTIAAIPDARHF